MSQKSFIIWGLMIISLYPITAAIALYLGISRIVEMDKLVWFSMVGPLIATPLAFGGLLYLRFTEIGRRKRIVALCILLYLITLTITSPSMLYNDYIITGSGAQDRFDDAIGVWAQTHDADTLMVWTVKQKLDYVLIMLPMNYLANWGLFALLWFGSLDPRTPSKNRVTQLFKTGFQRKPKVVKGLEFTNLAHS